MNTRFSVAGVLCLLFAIRAGAFELPWETGFAFEQQPADARSETVAARVNGLEITQGMLRQEINKLTSRMRGQVSPQQMVDKEDEIAQGAMENLITRQLLIAEARATGVTASTAEVEEVITRARGQIPPNSTLEEQLGMSYSEFEESIRTELEINKVLVARATPDAPSDAEIARFHEEHLDEHFTLPERVEARHILISTERVALHQARANIESIREQLLAGADFAELARAASHCPSSTQGGNLGTFARGQMAPPFEEAAFTQEVGAIGEIVETRFGFHIIQVQDRMEAGIQSLEESRDQIATFLKSQARDAAVRAYINELRKNADIEVFEIP